MCEDFMQCRPKPERLESKIQDNQTFRGSGDGHLLNIALVGRHVGKGSKGWTRRRHKQVARGRCEDFGRGFGDVEVALVAKGKLCFVSAAILSRHDSSFLEVSSRPEHRLLVRLGHPLRSQLGSSSAHDNEAP